MNAGGSGPPRGGGAADGEGPGGARAEGRPAASAPAPPGRSAGRVRVGTQGWAYPAWIGPFYPPEARGGDLLALYARAFDTVEVDSTFYALPPADRFRSWRDRTPPGFVFSLKVPAEITHECRLRGDLRLLRELCDRAALLEDKLGQLLIQLPRDLGPAEAPAVRRFFRHLPAGFSFAIEFRDPRWFTASTLELVRSAGVALAVSRGPWLPARRALHLASIAPGPLLYLRWMGNPRALSDLPSLVARRDRELDAWARLLVRPGESRRIFGYFNDDYQGHAPESARRLQRRLGQEPVPPGRISGQPGLFDPPPALPGPSAGRRRGVSGGLANGPAGNSLRRSPVDGG